jgi:hypothetical protein
MLLPFLLTALLGCRQEDEILQKTVTHEDREKMRLRVAILEEGDAVWFVRLDGPAELVKNHEADFDAFVRSTEFTGKKGEPVQWKEPPGWKKDPPRKNREATYRIDARPKELEVKISKLPAKAYRLMDNMHRWQKQVDVPLSESAEDNKPYLKTEKVGKIDVTWVDMSGLGVHTVSRPAAANADRQKDPLGGLQIEDQAKQPFKYTVPAGWVSKDPGEFALEAFEVGADGLTARITVTSLSGPMAADPVTNINRWRKNVGLPPVPPKEIENSVRLIQVGGVKSISADIVNPAGPPAKNRIVAVMVPLNRRTSWFIVMTGPSDVVGQHKNAFETFVQSFKK